jgi:hypothetical protein
MENSQELLTDTLVEEVIEETVTEATESQDMEPAQDMEPTQEEPDFQEPTQTMSALDQLINRRTGFFSITLDLTDLKWIKNACGSNKFTFTGPNEAFMVMNCFLGFSSAIARFEQEQAENSESNGSIQVQASAIEAAAILLNKYQSSGLESAQRVFRIAVALNQSVMEMKQLDQIINQLKVEEAKQAELAKEAVVNPS